jgi:hypothetical protein
MESIRDDFLNVRGSGLSIIKNISNDECSLKDLNINKTVQIFIQCILGFQKIISFWNISHDTLVLLPFCQARIPIAIILVPNGAPFLRTSKLKASGVSFFCDNLVEAQGDACIR